MTSRCPTSSPTFSTGGWTDSGDAWSVARALGIADRPLTHARAPRGRPPSRRTGLTARLRDLDGVDCLHHSTMEQDVQLRHPLLAEAVRRRLVAGEAPTCTVASPPCWLSHGTRLRPRSPTTGPARRMPRRNSAGGSGPPDGRRPVRGAHRRPTSGSARSRSRRTRPTWPVCQACGKADAYVACLDALQHIDWRATAAAVPGRR